MGNLTVDVCDLFRHGKLQSRFLTVLALLMVGGVLFYAGCKRVDTQERSVVLAVSYFSVVNDTTGEPLQVGVATQSPFLLYYTGDNRHLVAIALPERELPEIRLEREGYRPHILDRDYVSMDFAVRAQIEGIPSHEVRLVPRPD